MKSALSICSCSYELTRTPLFVHGSFPGRECFPHHWHSGRWFAVPLWVGTSQQPVREQKSGSVKAYPLLYLKAMVFLYILDNLIWASHNSHKWENEYWYFWSALFLSSPLNTCLITGAALSMQGIFHYSLSLWPSSFLQKLCRSV